MIKKNNIRVNNRLERTAEVTSSAPKADAKPSEENIHDKGRKAVDRLAALLREWAISKGFRIEIKVNPATGDHEEWTSYPKNPDTAYNKGMSQPASVEFLRSQGR